MFNTAALWEGQCHYHAHGSEHQIKSDLQAEEEEELADQLFTLKALVGDSGEYGEDGGG